MADYKFLLPEKDLPTHWYNILPDMVATGGPPPPPLHPGTHQPIGPDDLAPLFPMALIAQEVSQERFIEIPEAVREVYKLWRPSPVMRAHRLEQALGTRAHIYYKYEGVSPAGSHKPNTAVAQAYYNKMEGTKRLTTETGAGQWGSALSLACNYFEMELKVYMVKVSYEQKPYRRIMMETWGGNVVPSPSTDTNAGRQVLAENPDSPGSLGIAISEAVEDAATREDTKYALGSVLNHVLLHQTVVGEEAIKQMEMAGEYPDACPSLTRGEYVYDFGDTAGITPLVKMYTLGHTFVPPGIHAGGLRYHGMAPLICELHARGHIEAQSYPQTKVFESAIQFARTEGIIPAPESAHAICSAIGEARAADEAGEDRVILFNLSGHGDFDLAAYDQYLSGRLQDYAYPEEMVQAAMATVPKVGV